MVRMMKVRDHADGQDHQHQREDLVHVRALAGHVDERAQAAAAR